MAPTPQRPVRRLAVLATAAVMIGSVGCSSGNDDGSGSTSTTDANAGPTAAADADVVLASDGELVATVDERFQSYNVEMVEVTGGEFWKPYDAGEGKVVRPPLDLGFERLRNLA